MRKIFAVSFAFVIVVVLVMASPVMNIKTIAISGNERISNQEILTSAGLLENTNIFSFRTVAAIESLYRNTYIKHVDINRDFRGRALEINIVERQLSAYVKFRDNTYLFVDVEGMVLESRTAFTERYPVVEGLKFSEFTVGEYLEVENPDALNSMLLLSRLFDEFDIADDIIRIDLSRDNEIHFYYGNINIQMGSRQDLALKIKTMMEILPTLESYKHIGGFLYMQDPLRPRFSLLS